MSRSRMRAPAAATRAVADAAVVATGWSILILAVFAPLAVDKYRKTA